MSEEISNSGAKPDLTQKKIDNLYKIIMMYKRPSLIAKLLNVDDRTFKSWINKGKEILDIHKGFASELADCYLDGFLEAQLKIDQLEMVEEESSLLEQEFLKQTKQDKVNVKNIGRFEEFKNRKYNEIFEEVVAKKENEMIDSYNFCDNESKNIIFQRYVKVFRIATRADLAMKGFYISNIDKHSGTSKNVNLSKWMLELTDEEFKVAPAKVDVIHSGNISLIDLSIQNEKIKNKQENKDEHIKENSENE